LLQRYGLEEVCRNALGRVCCSAHFLMNHISSALDSGPELNLEIKRLNRLRVKASMVAGPLVVLIAILTPQPELTHGLLDAGGALLIAAGLGLRLSALGCIAGNKKRVLVTWGPYRYLRHPLYCGSFLFLLGFCMLAGSPSAALLAGLMFIGLYLPAVRAEERFLACRFGAEWRTYCEHTWTFVPRLSSRLPRVHAPFCLQRPIRELGILLLLSLVTFGASELMRDVQRMQTLLSWFL
jgi:protein-S-isoprenylcysteine O-methyltransferase Ste14